jgi:nicotinate-nucleotide pyrophosphorylase (carboxylating)
MTTLSPLPDVMLRPLIEAALLEDLGRAGDITTDAIIPPDVVWEAKLNARQAGVVAGMDLARLAFTVFDPEMSFVAHKADGAKLTPGDCLATIKGRARSLLSCERVALNYLGHLSGIASETNKLVEAVQPHKAHIACTRKTTPGLRAVEKFAVRAGGGFNHRFGVDDAVLIKDNHIAVAGGVRQAIERARASIGHLVKVELEVDSLEQLDEALALYDRAQIGRAHV